MEQVTELAEGLSAQPHVAASFAEAVQEHRTTVVDVSQHLEVSIAHLRARTRSFPDGLIAWVRGSEACVRHKNGWPG